MPRARDIGWQHGKMIGGHRHHVQCNYCHRTMIGGVTRFKKHLASKRGEIRGCEAVPQEVRELIKKHLTAGKTRKAKKKKRVNGEALSEPSSEDGDTDSDGSDREMAAARLESLRTLHEAEIDQKQNTNDDQQPMVGTREFFDAFSTVQSKNEQGSAPPRATDVGWAHGLMVNGDRQKIQCRYCLKVILGGGISRLKQHLAGERGNIAPCEKVPEDVKAQMQQHLGFKILEKLKRQKESERKNPLLSTLQGRDEGNADDIQNNAREVFKRINSGRRRKKEENEESSSIRKKHKTQIVPIATSEPVATFVPQLISHEAFAPQESTNQADMAVAKFMYDAGIPLNAANSPYFQKMADAITAVGPGYKMPTYHSLRDNLLNRSVQEAEVLCQEVRKLCEPHGCSVMADRWTDRTGRTIINFYVHCSKGAMFLKAIDASEISKSAEALFRLFDNIVQEVGPRNIVHFVTDTTPNYKAAGKLLASKYKTFFWSACAAHCIDLIFEELGEMHEVKEVLGKAKRICQFIYNNSWVLDLMRKKTGGRDIVRPSITRSMTNFLTLQSIISLKDSLHQMFTSTTWMESTFSKLTGGLEVTDIVVDPLFWSLCGHILKITDPFITVLHQLYSEEKPSMGYIHDAMEKAKRSITSAFDDREFDYVPYLKVIDHIWEEELHSPLHAAACYLNPSIFYNLSSSSNKLIKKGLLDCIETLAPDATAQDMIAGQLSFYQDAVGDFGRPVAVRGRETLVPAEWWYLYGADCPELQQLARRILNQTCTRIHCPRNWSLFERTHLKNRLKHERLNNLMLVHYNLRVHDRQSAITKMINGEHDPLCLEQSDVVGDWIEDSGVLEGEELAWVDVEAPSDANSFNPWVLKVDYPNHDADGCTQGNNSTDGDEGL